MRKLDENQERIANHFYGPALVLAGPGSGKTTVLTERTVKLSLKTKKPDKILCVTFTKSAALEMEKRYIAKAQKEINISSKPVFKTVHSLCNYILKEYECYTGLCYKRLTSELEICNIFGKIYEDVNNSAATDSILKYILQYGNQKTQSNEIKNISLIIDKYKEYKKANYLIDFDDMVSCAHKILHSAKDKDKKFREYFTNLYDFIQIDEAQDLTREQFEVLEKSINNDNIFVVADDDQSIYGFRGAEPKNLFMFKEKHINCKIYHLSRNYRSCKEVVLLSKNVISINKERFQKDLYTLNENETKPRLMCVKNAVKQAEFIVNEIYRLRKMQPKLSVGILFRNNLSGIIPGAVFAVNQIRSKKESGYIHTCDISCMDKLINNIRKAERKHIFVPSPGKIFRNMLEEDFEKKVASVCKKEGKERIYSQYLLLLFDYLCSNADSLQGILKILEAMDYNDSNSEVCLTTIHSAKGLEFDAVFVIDMIMSIFPGKYSVEIGNIEEERRLFYVAITRARKYLYILYPFESHKGNIRGTSLEKSVFVEEIEKFGK